MYSKTIWIGHVSKGVDEAQLSDKIKQYGTVKSVDVCCRSNGYHGDVCLSFSLSLLVGVPMLSWILVRMPLRWLRS